jgi:RND family efflux transporter MFP subunit
MRQKLIPALTVLASLALAACGSQDTPSQADNNTMAISVRGQVLAPASEAVVRTYTATLEGEKQAVLYARLAEAVEKVHVAEGDRVNAEQVVISLDKHGATSGYRAALAPFENARKLYEKMSYLYQEGAVSETEFDRARTDYESAKAQLESIEKMLGVRSPIAGVVTSIDVSEGDFVQVGQRLATVASIGRVRARFPVNANEVQQFAVGDEVVLMAEAAADTAVGRVVSVARSADPMTRAFMVETQFDNPGGSFRPGTFVRIKYIIERLDSILLVPRRAILILDNIPTVFTVSDNVARANEVTMSAEINGNVVITSGLEAGDTIVVLGQDYLHDGATVRISELSE